MKYGVQVYYSFLLLFQSLPLAAVISTSYGQLFACHGGLSPTIDTLDDLSKIDRFTSSCCSSFIFSSSLLPSSRDLDLLSLKKIHPCWTFFGLIQSMRRQWMT
jgi:diadenosine tetraphosphatase ApaH/serine/threonine PP2A family protein phosphatase